jgi:hypothetical protein
VPVVRLNSGPAVANVKSAIKHVVMTVKAMFYSF